MLIKGQRLHAFSRSPPACLLPIHQPYIIKIILIALANVTRRPIGLHQTFATANPAIHCRIPECVPTTFKMAMSNYMYSNVNDHISRNADTCMCNKVCAYAQAISSWVTMYLPVRTHNPYYNLRSFPQIIYFT